MDVRGAIGSGGGGGFYSKGYNFLNFYRKNFNLVLKYRNQNSYFEANSIF